MQINNQKDFDETMRNYRGAFPVLLTTDGETLGLEFDDGTDGWKPEGVVIDTINNCEVWPSYPEAKRCLALAKRGWRGEELKAQIDQIQTTCHTRRSAC
jgi:hypothetical protein